MIAALQGTERPRVKVVDEQTAEDIVAEICSAHPDHAADYDRIAGFFADGDIWEVCRDLWYFCKRNLWYVVETEKVQNVGCPYWILTHGVVDCKNYASFIGGVLDALKRRGYRIVWEYRFVSYRAWSIVDCHPDHVFVVCNPNTDDIWVDPVLDYFNERLFYFYKLNRRMRTVGKRIGAIGGRIGCGCHVVPIGTARMGSTSAEATLMADVAAYAQGLSGYIGQTNSTGLFNQVTEGILLGVAVAVIPGAAIAIAALKLGALAADSAFGAGSASARILTDLSNLNVTALFSDIMGRTYETDQYWAAVYYQFYVLGNQITDIQHVTDSMVLPALKWFIDKSGVFISGRQHIIALTQGSQQYAAQYNVDTDTTRDMTLINAASLMAKKYWPSPGNYAANLKGAWANTIGVYDLTVVNLANAQGKTSEQYVAETGAADQNAQTYVAEQSGSPLSFLTQNSILSSVPNWVLLAGGGLLIFALSAKK